MQQIFKSAQIGQSTTIGHFVVIQDNVKIGRNCQIGNHVVIHSDTVIGDNVRIDDHVVIGKLPMKAANSALAKEQSLSGAKIGNHCLIGSSAILYRGSEIGDFVLAADLSTIRENVTVGAYTIVGRGVAIECESQIGSYCKLETNTYITAYSCIEDYCFVAPCVATSNDEYIARGPKGFQDYQGVTIRKGGRVGVHATILPGKVIAEESVVAAGSVLTRDTDPKKIYLGSPAKEFRDVPTDQLLENQPWRKK